MKHLRVEYNGIVLFDGGVDEVNWSDGPNGISVNGKFGKSASVGGGVAGGLMDLLTAASKKQTEAKIEEKKASLLVDSKDQEEASI
jgi:hypothetical protein